MVFGCNYASARQTVEAIALIAERDRNPLLSGSLKKIDDETLRGELEKRGYKVLDPRDDEATAEILKIG